MGNNEFKKVRIKNRTCYYLDKIIQLENFDTDNILIDEKSHENILIYDISYKTLIWSKPLRIRFEYNIVIVIRIRCSYLKIISLKSGVTYIFFTILRKSKLILVIIYL